LAGAAMSEKTALLEAAYDEYCRVQESSNGVDVEQFLSRYSTIRSSLRRQICVHDFLVHRSHVVDLCRDVQWPAIGDTVCDFTVLEELGRGASRGSIFAARPASAGGSWWSSSPRRAPTRQTCWEDCPTPISCRSTPWSMMS
jgi:hypothetical protein